MGDGLGDWLVSCGYTISFSPFFFFFTVSKYDRVL